MKGKANRAVAPLSEGGSGYGATWRAIARKSEGGFRFDTPQLAAGSFIRKKDESYINIKLSGII
jgi:hypothetical protein